MLAWSGNIEQIVSYNRACSPVAQWSQSSERSHQNSVTICSKLMSVGTHGRALIRIHKLNQKLAVSISQLGVRRFGRLGNKNYIQRLYWHARLLIIDRDQSYCIFIFPHFKWASRVIRMDVALTFFCSEVAQMCLWKIQIHNTFHRRGQQQDF